MKLVTVEDIRFLGRSIKTFHSQVDKPGSKDAMVLTIIETSSVGKVDSTHRCFSGFPHKQPSVYSVLCWDTFVCVAVTRP